MSKQIVDAQILNNIRLNDKYFIIKIQPKFPLEKIYAGQFLQLEIPDVKDVFLRRPFSIHDVDFQNNTIDILVQIVGKGTYALSNLKTGRNVNIIYPLGKGYTYTTNSRVLLVGGGCGIAPLLFLAKELKSRGNILDIILGFRTKQDVIEEEYYKLYGNTYITTEDGSYGQKGYVTHHSIFENLKIYERVYTCGPEVMMKAVAKRSEAENIICEVSLENTMACGIGACLCCVTKTVGGNICVCTEGPVFNSKYLVW